jgi:hypothetical protein
MITYPLPLSLLLLLPLLRIVLLVYYIIFLREVGCVDGRVIEQDNTGQLYGGGYWGVMMMMMMM